MAKVEIKTCTEPIRLFESYFLEFFTHVSPVVTLIIWLPVSACFIYLSLTTSPKVAVVLSSGILVGLFLRTLLEYLLHRFIFHYPAKNEWQERGSFLVHGIHHKQSKVKTRLVMPPALSIRLAAVFYGLFYAIINYVLFNPEWLVPVFTGFILAYIAYDMMHYSNHHFSMRK